MPPSVAALAARLRSRARRVRLGPERGSVLVEVMVGALVLGIATAAILDGLAGAEDTGMRNKDRSLASNLAQQDIERLRSIPITSLSNYEQTRSVKLGGTTYTVVSDTDWVRDSSGVVSCTTETSEAEYLRISSTVTSPASVDSPVTEVTLLTPAPGAFGDNTGTLAVQLTDRDGLPASGLTVSMTGPSTVSDTTNPLGCAIFGFIPQGAYTATVNGLVSWSSTVPASSKVNVYEGKTSLSNMQVEEPASIRAQFELPSSPAPPAGLVAAWKSISVANAKLPAAVKSFTAANPATSIDVSELFPFLDGYGVYAGTCAANNPASWQSSYFQSSGKGFAQLDPGDFLEPVPVAMPWLTVKLKDSNNNPITGHITVKTRDSGSGCQLNQLVYDGPTEDGEKHFALPFGRYRICADNDASTSTKRRRRETTASPSSPGPTNPKDPSLTPPSGLGVTTEIKLPGSGSASSC